MAEIGEFDGDTTPEALAAWERYRALPENPGTESYTPVMSEQDAFTTGFDAGRASRLVADGELNLEEIKARATRQSVAHSKMLEFGGGVGKLAVEEPQMFEDMLAWDDSTDDGHADTVLALVSEVERLRLALEQDAKEIFMEGYRASWTRYDDPALVTTADVMERTWVDYQKFRPTTEAQAR